MIDQTELKEICQRLNHYEQEPPGITVEEAIAIGDRLFPEDGYSIENAINFLCDSVPGLKQGTEIVGESNILATCICLLLVIMHRVENSHEPNLFLWGKYMNNSYRFSGLMIQNNTLSTDEYLEEMKKSKREAERAGWNDRKALARFYDFFYNGGWYYFPDGQADYPHPIGSNDLNIYQLVTKHFLLSFPHTFSRTELYDLLLEELHELRMEVFNTKLDKWNIAFEAADVIIYLLHIASEFNIDVSESIKNIGKSSHS
ncbi:hypothetical protein M0R04_01845 [Candidatus Dojkabacteria bacterium]|jgi:NTP pyrophosphatase (non-canonical NTP hydrolase)|nr:hypothetical protein [Candidatus Dojkabacteria bacterium]